MPHNDFRMFREILIAIDRINEYKNPFDLLKALEEMTNSELLEWIIVRGSSSAVKIVASPKNKYFSVTLTKVRLEYSSPLLIEVRHQAEDLLPQKYRVLSLDPGDFVSSVDVMIWQGAMRFFRVFYRSATINYLTGKTDRADRN